MQAQTYPSTLPVPEYSACDVPCTSPVRGFLRVLGLRLSVGMVDGVAMTRPVTIREDDRAAIIDLTDALYYVHTSESDDLASAYPESYPQSCCIADVDRHDVTVRVRLGTQRAMLELTLSTLQQLVAELLKQQGRDPKGASDGA